MFESMNSFKFEFENSLVSRQLVRDGAVNE